MKAPLVPFCLIRPRFVGSLAAEAEIGVSGSWPKGCNLGTAVKGKKLGAHVA